MVEQETPVEPVVSVPNESTGSFAGDVLKLVSGTTAALAITVLTAPVLSRLYAPEAFGTLAVFVSMVGIASVIVGLRYEQAIMLPEHAGEAVNVLAVSFSATLMVSGSSAVLISIAHEPILRGLNAPHLAPYLWLVPVALLVQGTFQVMNYWNARSKRFGRLSIARVAASLTTSLTPMGLSAIGRADGGALIGSWVAGTMVFTATLAGQTWKEIRRLFRGNVTLRRMLDSLKRYRKFPLVDSWGSFINTLSWQLPALMLSSFFSQTTVGYYSLSNRVIMLPMTLLGHSIGQVFFQRAAALRSSPDQLASTVKTVFQRLVALGLLPALLLTIAGKELFIAVFGDDWAEAGVYAQFLAPWLFFLFISSPLSNLFAVLERQELALIVHIMILLTRIMALTIGGLLQDIYLTLVIWTFSGILVYGGLSIRVLKLAGVSIRSAIRITLKYGLYCIPPVAIVLPIKWLSPSDWILLAATAAVLAVYVLVILRQDPAIHQYLGSAMRIRPKYGSESRTKESAQGRFSRK
jgi:lipopolysaccharide exporter